MAHLPNDKGEFKTKSKLLNLYPSDFYAASRKAKEANLTLTEYMIRCITGKNNNHHIFKVNWKTYRAINQIVRQLQYIGNNINQIAKVLNTERLEGGNVPANLPLPEELTALRSCIDELIKETSHLNQSIIGREQQ